MNAVTIYSDNTIGVGSTITGYWVRQESDGTKVRAWTNNGRPRPVDLGEEVKMPRDRYTLSTKAGSEEFAADFLKVWNLGLQIEDARERVGAWKARREGNIDDSIASAVYALDDRYPAGWGLNTFKACLEMIEEGVDPALAADEA
jgi:hypothetical protein